MAYFCVGIYNTRHTVTRHTVTRPHLMKVGNYISFYTLQAWITVDCPVGYAQTSLRYSKAQSSPIFYHVKLNPYFIPWQ